MDYVEWYAGLSEQIIVTEHVRPSSYVCSSGLLKATPLE
jgi:hypothetical protein